MQLANDEHKNQQNYNLLEQYGFKQKFDGIPILHFERKWFDPFTNACGQIAQDGYTLKDRYKDVDPGGFEGMIVAPGRPLNQVNGQQQTHANATQMRQKDDRDRRLFNVAMSCIDPQSYFYAELNEECPNMGRTACLMILDRGKKNIPDEVKERMEKDWNAMTIDSLKLKIDELTVSRFFNIVMVKGAEFDPEKSYAAIRSKFLNGMTHHLKSEVNAELMRPNADYNFPNQYARPHPLAGQRHPFAGMCNPLKLMQAFDEVWKRMLDSGHIRSANMVMWENLRQPKTKRVRRNQTTSAHRNL